MTRPPWLNAQRVSAYMRIVLVLYAVTLVVFVAVSPDGLDPLGRPLGNDFLAFWSAARLAVAGEPAAAWDIGHLFEAGRQALPEVTLGYVFSYPPVFQLLLMPLGLLPWAWALAVWSGLGLAAYLTALRPLMRSTLAVMLALAFPAAFVNLLQGQTGVFSLALLGGGLWLVPRRPLLAGGLIGLACFKPHLGLVIPLALLAGRQWRTLAAATAVVAGLIALSLLVLGPDPWSAFLRHLGQTTALLETGAVPWDKMPSAFAALRLTGAPVAVAYAGQAMTALIGAAVATWLWACRPAAPMTLAATICALLLVPPHVNDHDLVLLALPLGLVALDATRTGWRAGERAALAVIWSAPLLLAPLAEATGLQLGPLAVLGLLALVLRRA
ncbi:glycosyltransferase family 87 protein [Roseospira goensis]|uniref:DUF2029 domain-containing protein n=1 Tax=Roseospira goensis TaxID=391922 RepID=A0A7W6S0A1_9PROT|nr:glycosyltransferase family 87 protein [Roseospira goensis]MBB4286490.1 hypothetical protein [Roseospira goensis]